VSDYLGVDPPDDLERCVHDMLPGTCGLCEPRSQREMPERSLAEGPAFRRGLGTVSEQMRALPRRRGDSVLVAQYESRCSECGDLIEPGDPITRGPDDNYVHLECA